MVKEFQAVQHNRRVRSPTQFRRTAILLDQVGINGEIKGRVGLRCGIGEDIRFT